MTCGLFLILHLVLCVRAIDPGTSTECTETWILTESGRYSLQVHVNRLIAGVVVAFLSLSESYWRQPLVSSPREICCCLHLTLPLWVPTAGREALPAPFWRRS